MTPYVNTNRIEVMEFHPDPYELVSFAGVQNLRMGTFNPSLMRHQIKTWLDAYQIIDATSTAELSRQAARTRTRPPVTELQRPRRPPISRGFASAAWPTPGGVDRPSSPGVECGRGPRAPLGRAPCRGPS